ncbi:hypothetical protein HMPREF9336_04059 [Segniliparus rugosus ATCC BAA-974]|uniref:Uncharacterized protein n=1 Tax=Segniliparus rugosus (strain ATCC BAA-974 / DSM 45345 / CCUG 50838 / CIP 108380 / JCM 13579 / CDC 945) TaxID=679197 RepID=U1N987_SEGRC|nr:hypothetical protein HMPREF9336_04059 [Segniliparus rugosus ATCC BAA-974]
MLGSIRGLNLIVFCRNSIVLEDKCDDVFSRTIGQFANID